MHLHVSLPAFKMESIGNVLSVSIWPVAEQWVHLWGWMASGHRLLPVWYSAMSKNLPLMAGQLLCSWSRFINSSRNHWKLSRSRLIHMKSTYDWATSNLRVIIALGEIALHVEVCLMRLAGLCSISGHSGDKVSWSCGTWPPNFGAKRQMVWHRYHQQWAAHDDSSILEQMSHYMVRPDK